MSTDHDLVIVGGGVGGIAAALSACAEGASVALTEQTDWLGGQFTVQGVSAPDEHEFIEAFGATKRYDDFRRRVRKHYRETHDVADASTPFNPGNCWVSRLGFEPRVGVEVIRDLCRPHREAGSLDVLVEHRPVDASVVDGRVRSVTLVGPERSQELRARQFLDATELGGLLPVTGTEYVTGAESTAMTGEPDARQRHRPTEVQSFTYTFAIEHHPGENHVIDPPEGYERLRATQPYSFEYETETGEVSTYRMFVPGPDDEQAFWTYRRLVDADRFADVERDVVMINWDSNDFRGASLLDKSHERQQEILRDARRLSKGFLYWLQTDAPRDDGGQGYPGLKLRSSVMATESGLSKFPYIREARRIVPKRRVVQTDVTERANDGARARNFEGSVGVGSYAIDVHGCVGAPEKSIFEPTLPFQVPLGALVPAHGPDNLLAAGKNIGTTHLTNGCYRLHPVEWAIGEAAGVLAAQCVAKNVQPPTVYDTPDARRAYQYALVADHGMPIAWTIDVPRDHDVFVPTQLLYANGAIERDSDRYDDLAVGVNEPLSCRDLRSVVTTACGLLGRTAVVPVSTDLDSTADREAVTDALGAAGLPHDDLSAEPTWMEVCRAIAPPLRAWMGRS